MRLTAGDLTVQYITYSSTADSRQLTINTTTATSRALTLDGGGVNPLIAHVGGSGTTFSIHTNSGTGTAALSLRLNASGDFNVQNSGATLSISSVITETGGPRSINKTGNGTLVLSGANTYSGGTTLTGGTISLGADNVIPDTGTFTFAGGILAANNRTDTIGQLSLTADSSLNLSPGGSAGALSFASAAWTSGTLTINGWTGTPGEAGTDDRIYFTVAPEATFLDHVYFDIGGNLYFADMIGNELVAGVTPVPEPINVALGVFGVLFGGIGLWRRHRASRSA